MVRDKDLISVIVPVYNVESYIDKCIKSIVDQTYSNLEIILVNDGSTDNSLAHCIAWKRKDPRITVYDKKNGGLSDARNYGIKHSHGKYLGFVDSDDYIKSDMYQLLYQGIVKFNAQIACGGRIMVENSGYQKPCFTLSSDKVFNSHDALKELLKVSSINEAAWDKLYKKDLFNHIEFPKNEINEDIVIMPTLIDRAKKIAHVGKPVYYYVKHEGSITTKPYNKDREVIYKHLKNLRTYIIRKHMDLLPAFYSLEYNYLLSELTSIENNKNNLHEFYKIRGRYKKLYNQDFIKMMLSTDVANFIKIKSLSYKFGLYKFFKKLVKK